MSVAISVSPSPMRPGNEQGQLRAGGRLHPADDQPDQRLFGSEGPVGGLGHLGATLKEVRFPRAAESSRPARRHKLLQRLAHCRDLEHRFAHPLPTDVQKPERIEKVLGGKGAPELRRCATTTTLPGDQRLAPQVVEQRRKAPPARHPPMTTPSSSGQERFDLSLGEKAGLDVLDGHPPSQLANTLQQALHGARRVAAPTTWPGTPRCAGPSGQVLLLVPDMASPPARARRPDNQHADRPGTMPSPPSGSRPNGPPSSGRPAHRRPRVGIVAVSA